MYGTSYDNVGEKEAEKSISTAASIDALAEEFTRQVPELVFSPAAMQGYMLMYQDDPLGAVDAIGGWVDEQQRIKEKKAETVEVSGGEEEKTSTASESEAEKSETLEATKSSKLTNGA
jgi:chaperone BCS1